MLKTILKLLLTLVFLAAAGAIGWKIRERLLEQQATPARVEERLPAPVEVAPVERAELVLRRTISGTLEASAEFMVAPKTSGRLVELHLDIADRVTRGQVVARLDDAESVQAVAQAEADHAVAQAQLAEALGSLEIAERTLNRVQSLRERDMAAETAYDTAKADEVAKRAQVAVARARIERTDAVLAAERIRLGYTRVVADWSDGGDERVVAERMVDEGETVSANSPLYRVVKLDPIVGVVFVPERDYARMRTGQTVELTTDAYVGVRFAGTIDRIAPVFRESTRQARVELRVANQDERLRPGMFIRATVELERRPDATVVPYAALTKRGEQTGLYVVEADGRRVRWLRVAVGIVEGARVEVTPQDGALRAPGDRVVTLGQHLLGDGSEISIPGDDAASGTASVE